MFILPVEISNLLLNKEVIIVVDNAKSPVISATKSSPLLPALRRYRKSTPVTTKTMTLPSIARKQVKRRASPPIYASGSRWDTSSTSLADQMMKPVSREFAVVDDCVGMTRTSLNYNHDYYLPHVSHHASQLSLTKYILDEALQIAAELDRIQEGLTI